MDNDTNCKFCTKKVRKKERYANNTKKSKNKLSRKVSVRSQR